MSYFEKTFILLLLTHTKDDTAVRRFCGILVASWALLLHENIFSLSNEGIAVYRENVEFITYVLHCVRGCNKQSSNCLEVESFCVRKLCSSYQKIDGI